MVGDQLDATSFVTDLKAVLAVTNGARSALEARARGISVRRLEGLISRAENTWGTERATSIARYDRDPVLGKRQAEGGPA